MHSDIVFAPLRSTYEHEKATSAEVAKLSFREYANAYSLTSSINDPHANSRPENASSKSLLGLSDQLGFTRLRVICLKARRPLFRCDVAYPLRSRGHRSAAHG